MIHPVFDNLKKLRLKGMIEALKIQLNNSESSQLHFEERLALIVENEVVLRENNRLQVRLKKAKLRQNACIQDIDYRGSRGLDRTLMLSLESCKWIDSHKNILIVGATGTGKTYLGEALAHNACMRGYSAHHLRIPRFFNELALSKVDGRYSKWMKELAKYDVLLLDDLGVSPFNDENRRDLLEIIDERHHKKATIITSQLSVNHWHEMIGDKTLADAILDRLVHNAYRIELKGESMRKLRSQSESVEKTKKGVLC